jgi:low temperature requirement protein LtrA
MELFYDLVFVAAFIQLGNGLSSHVSVVGFIGFAAVFMPMWVAWTGMTFFTNRFTVDDTAHRALVILQMFAVGAMSLSASDVLDGEPQTFALSYAIAQGIVALLYARTYAQVPEGRAYSRYWGSVFGFGAIAFAISAFVPTPWCYVLWGVGLIGILTAPFKEQSRQLADRYPGDEEHLTERYGLLTIIVLGESFVKVLSSLNDSGQDMGALLQASFVLLITCCIWWVYFDDVAGSKIKKRKLAPIIWLYGHLPLQIAITATGVAVKKAVGFELTEVAPDGYRWLLAGSLALVMGSVALIDSVTERRQAELSDRLRVNVRFATAGLLLVLAPAGAAMTAGVFVGLVTALCVAQVVFDMMMAPSVEMADHEMQPTIGERMREAEGEAEVKLNKRPTVGDAVRKGTPSELRRDVYFYFMEGSWTRVIVAFSFLFVVVNVFFAALYTLVPGCVDGVHPDSFGDAFFFSVQTISTIGFGAMSPETSYGHTIVTVEAAVGMFSLALATGLFVAKASRARASVLFSEPMVLTNIHGKRTLVFRVGNARGNDVVDAAITVSVLFDELSPEGHHLRRLHDLELVRSRSPLFTLSWVVMHEIDESSPCKVVNWESPGDSIIAIIVTLTGHDGTYNDSIYARHMYYAEDIRLNHRFVDVISELEDGRLLIDYSKFHDVEPDVAGDTAS